VFDSPSRWRLGGFDRRQLSLVIPNLAQIFSCERRVHALAQIAPVKRGPAAEEFGATDSRGALTTAILEYEQGVAIVALLSTNALLLVLAQPSANVGRLLFELRRNRENISSLV